MRILVIEDSRTMRAIIRGVLAQLGHHDVTEAEDGLDALTMVAETDPELVLLDWNLPNLDGLAVAKRIRAQGRRMPIIMVTTEVARSRVVEAIKAGVDNYVVKPFTPDILSQRIQETLDPACLV